MLSSAKTIFSLVLFGLLLTVSAGDLAEIIKAGKLRAAITDTETPPFMTRNRQNEYHGFELDLLKLCAETMGVKLELVPVDSFDGLVTALTEDKADIAMSELSLTLPRILQVDFSQPYVKLPLALLVNRKEMLRMRKNESLDNFLRHYDGPLMLPRATCRIEQVKAIFPKAQLIFSKNRGEVENLIRQRKLVAYFDDPIIIRSMMQTDVGSHLFYQRVILEDTVDDVCIALQPNCPRLKFYLDRFLEQYMHRINNVMKSVR